MNMSVFADEFTAETPTKHEQLQMLEHNFKAGGGKKQNKTLMRICTHHNQDINIY